MATLAATLHLELAQIAEVGNPDSNVSGGTSGSIGGGGSRNDERTLSGEFRNYANGITRLILGSSTARVVSVVLRALTPDQVDMLHSLSGKLCVLRDTYGRVVFGSFIDTQETNIPLSSSDGTANTILTDVAFTFTEVTYSEVV